MRFLTISLSEGLLLTFLELFLLGKHRYL